MRVLIAANTDWYLHQFRTRLIAALVARGDEVALACPDGPYRPGLEALGARWLGVALDRRGMNPAAEMRSAAAHRRVLKAARPDVVHAFTLKSILALGLAQEGAVRRPGVVNSYEGLGYLFHSADWKARIGRVPVSLMLKRINWRPRTATVVLNAEDRATFVAQGLAPAERLHVVPGAGVDLSRFAPRAAPPPRFSVLFASRLLHDKGIGELVEAVTLLRADGRDVTLRVAGGIDPGNPSSVTADELAAWGRRDGIELLGHRSDIPDLIAASSAVALVSSYGEGLPTILAEAGACGVPVITSAKGGCREIVVDGENGLIVPARDPQALAAAIARLMDDPALCDRLGRAGRARVEARFAVETINAALLRLYDQVAA